MTHELTIEPRAAELRVEIADILKAVVQEAWHASCHEWMVQRSELVAKMSVEKQIASFDMEAWWTDWVGGGD